MEIEAAKIIITRHARSILELFVFGRFPQAIYFFCGNSMNYLLDCVYKNCAQ
jgi:hypothetical protein